MVIDKATDGPPTAPYSPLALSLLAIVVGVVAGFGAVAFRGLIAFFHNLFFLGQLSFFYDANLHTPPSPWGALVILVPVLGAVVVAFLVRTFAPEAKGHGVPEVMDAIYYNKGVIRPVVALIKALASALSIGSGGSVGREGPIIQIGSSFGSTLGQLLPMPAWQRVTLIAAGAGGGIAATFNTPIGGVLFAIEIMLPEISVRTLVPVAIATATATYIGRLLFGPNPSFVILALQVHFFHPTNPVVLLSYIGLGVLLGAASALYIRSIYAFEDFFDKRIGGSYYRRHLLGMFLVGILMYVLMVTLGHYYVQGIGYATIQDVLDGTLTGLFLLVLLCVLKLLATGLTLGSGASGGVFSPALFIGATLGAAYGVLAQRLFPGLTISPAAFAVAGMAGMVGGATGAAMAAIVMIFEMTLDYNVIVPMTITVALSYGVRNLLSQESIYTLKLVRRGHYMPEALHANFHHLKRAREFMNTHLVKLDAATTLENCSRILSEQPDTLYFLVAGNDGIPGVLTREAALAELVHGSRTAALSELADSNYVNVSEEATLIDVLDRLKYCRASVALVMRDGTMERSEDVVGLISKEVLADALAQAMILLSDS